MAELLEPNVWSAPLRYANQTFDNPFHFNNQMLRIHYQSKKGRQLSHYLTLDRKLYRGYTLIKYEFNSKNTVVTIMKTAISIPDKLFDAADKYAKAQGVSRSNLYAKAIEQFLEQNPADHITTQLDKVYSGKDSKLNKTVASLQFHSIEKEEW